MRFVDPIPSLISLGSHIFRPTRIRETREVKRPRQEIDFRNAACAVSSHVMYDLSCRVKDRTYNVATAIPAIKINNFLPSASRPPSRKLPRQLIG